MDTQLPPYSSRHRPVSESSFQGLSPVFFCGGSALSGVAPLLAQYTSRAVYLVTPFDSGGSSATLRTAFDMPAVGDVRARLLSLADTSHSDIAQLCALCNLRFPQQTNSVLRPTLWRMAQGLHPALRALPHAARTLLSDHLRAFYKAMPADMLLGGACIGNLALAGGYLEAERNFGPVLDAWSKVLKTRGTVYPVVNACAHLSVRLADGTIMSGQHRITGKESASIASPIREIWLSSPDMREGAVALRPAIDLSLRHLIQHADLLCYPLGSFYSSVIASLLPAGVGQAVANASCPKVFVPTTVTDPELLGHSLRDQVERLLACLRADCGKATPTAQLLNVLLLDSGLHTKPQREQDTQHDTTSTGYSGAQDAENKAARAYPGGIPRAWLHEQGIRVIETDLVTPASAPYIEPSALCTSLCKLMNTTVR